MSALSLLPNIPTGYDLDDDLSRLSIIVPEATTNLIANPSFELSTTGWTGNNVTIARSLTQQYRGAYSLACTRSAGTDAFVENVAVAVTAGLPYTFSMYVFVGQLRAPCALARLLWYSAGPTLISGIVSDVRYQEHGAWMRVILTGYAPVGATLAVVRINLNAAEVGALIFADALQFENKIYPTTYVDGDEQPLLVAQFPAPFGWNGARHNSSSYRLATTRAGGRVLNLYDLGLLIVSIIGLGMPPVNAISDPLGLSDGSNYQRSIRSERPFTIAGRLSGFTNSELQRKRAQLRSYLAYDRTGIDQPLVLRYERVGQGAAGEIIASYTGGLEETADNRYGEDVSVGLTQWLPLIIHEGDRAVTLDGNSTFTIANIARQNNDGSWANFGTGANGAVNTIVQGPDGRIYIGGNFTTINGVAIERIAVYNATTGAFEAFSAGTTNDEVLTLAFGPNSTLYAGGRFTTIGGVALNRIAQWNGVAWVGVGAGGANDQVQSIMVASDGTVYAGGLFTNIGGVAINLAASWNGTTWAILGVGFSSAGIAPAVRKIVQGPDGFIYLGGSYFTVDGNPGDNITLYDGATLAELGGGVSDTVRGMAFGPDGRLYIGGTFLTAGGATAIRTAAWNGVVFSALGSGLTGSGATVFAIAPDRNGQIYYGGTFTTANADVTVDGIAFWNGSTWINVPIDFPGSSVRSLFFGADGAQWYGVAGAGSAQIGDRTIVANTANAPTYPQLIVNGPATGTSRLYRLTNNTTGAVILFNVLVSAGEVLTLTLDPGNISLISSTRGDITTLILPGSTVGTWALVPGNNDVVLFTASTMGTSLLQWRPLSLDTDDLIYR